MNDLSMPFPYYFNRLRTARKYPLWQWPAVAGTKVRQKFAAQRRRQLARRDRLACSELRLLASVGVGNGAELCRVLAVSPARFFLDRLSPALVATRLGTGRAAAICSAADAVCRHEFDLLGSGPVALGVQIDWHRDFKSGSGWDPNTYYQDFDWSRFPAGADVKVPWELSRFQHAPTLGQAYWLTQAGAASGREPSAYAREFVAQFLSWCDANPVPFGVNWICTMDVAIRVVNLIWGYFFFRDAPEWTDEVHVRFARSLVEHGEHILANPEKPIDGVTSNHYLSDVVGLIYLGVLFPQFRQAQQWREVGVRELVAEMDKQVHRDGADYESSLSYHRLVTELFASAAALCRLNAVALPRSFWERLERMFEFTLHYTRPDGHAPQIGDVDDGRLHVLADYGRWDRRDHRHLLAVGGALFERDDFARAAADRWEDAWWLCGDAACRPSERGAAPAVASRGFADSGFYFMRSRDRYMAIAANPVGTQGVGNHKHNDLLSFELYAGDKAFIIDPGTYLYTPDPESRNRFRATAYHNTVRVDGQEQNRFDPTLLFSLTNDARPRVRRWESTADFDFFDGEHGGYERLAAPVCHRRQIYFDKRQGFWVMRDVVTGAGVHRIELYLHFAPLPVVRDGEHRHVVRTDCGEGTNLAVVPLCGDGWQVELVEGWVSYGYGTKLPAPIVRYWTEGSLPVEFVAAYWPYTGALDVDVVRRAAMMNWSTI